MPVPPLPAGQRPNFIVIMTDDQGWDDVGLHYPKGYVRTPNLDKFIRHSTKFDNFYVTPMCAQSRAALLTGRDYAKTGTVLVSGGYDFLHSEEVTAAEVMKAGGYATAHFGKWHNGRSLGYEPWNVGFDESWHPEQYIHLDNLMRHNGEYVQTKGLMEQVLMDKVIGYLDQQAASSKPFFLFYAPNAIHRGSMRPGEGPKWTRPSPEPYKQNYKYLAGQGIPGSTLEVWAMLEYMDDVLGRLFDYVESSPLKQNTYVMIMSDNGAEVFLGELKDKDKRMPSKMQGYKRDVEEGGVRNFLAVQGPGIQAGVVDSTLVDLTDVLPTVVDLAGLPFNTGNHLPWDGLSMKNLLLTGPAGAPPSGRRGVALATPQQAERFIFSLGPMCWDSNAVPLLGPDRKTSRPQQLLDYDKGGLLNRELQAYYNDTGSLKGFQPCIAVRHKEYKWIGRTDKVYRFSGDSHVELPCNEVSGALGSSLKGLMAAEARKWWSEIVAAPHSFTKPTYYLGLGDWSVTNLLPDGAYERTPGRVMLLANGATGFQTPGDRMCFSVQVLTQGTYEVVIIYTSKRWATIKFSIGPFDQIHDGSAPSITSQLPPLSDLNGQFIGSLINLPASGGKPTDACLELVSNSSPGENVFAYLGDIRVTLRSTTVAVATTLLPTSSGGSGSSGGTVAGPPPLAGAPVSLPARSIDVSEVRSWLRISALESTGEDDEEAADAVMHPFLRPTPAMRQVERDAVADSRRFWDAVRNSSAAAASMSAGTGAGAGRRKERAAAARTMTDPAADWRDIRLRHNWPDGQDKLESVFSPYHAEGIDMCRECQPRI